MAIHVDFDTACRGFIVAVGENGEPTGLRSKCGELLLVSVCFGSFHAFIRLTLFFPHILTMCDVEPRKPILP